MTLKTELYTVDTNGVTMQDVQPLLNRVLADVDLDNTIEFEDVAGEYCPQCAYYGCICEVPQ